MHTSRIHKNDKCGYCDKVLNSPLERHINIVHVRRPGVRPERSDRSVPQEQGSSHIVLNGAFL